MKSILYIATIFITIVFLFWQEIEDYLGFYIFEQSQAFFIFLLCVYMFFTDKKSSIKFLLFCLSLNNLFDELFFDNTKLGINELLTAVGILIILVIRIRNDRKKSRFV